MRTVRQAKRGPLVPALLVLMAALAPSGPALAATGPHYVLDAEPAPQVLRQALDEELPGARVAPTEPHALHVRLRRTLTGDPAWDLALRRPGGRLILERRIGLSGGEEAARRVVVLLVSRTLARLRAADDVDPNALAELQAPVTDATPRVWRTTLALLPQGTLWQQPQHLRTGVAVEISKGGDRLRLGLQAYLMPHARVATRTLEATLGDIEVMAAAQILLVRAVRGTVALGIRAGLQVGWSTSRASFPDAPGSPGSPLAAVTTLPTGAVTVDLALDPGDPRLAILARAGFAIHPRPRRIELPPGYADDEESLEEGALSPLVALGLRLHF